MPRRWVVSGQLRPAEEGEPSRLVEGGIFDSTIGHRDRLSGRHVSDTEAVLDLGCVPNCDRILTSYALKHTLDAKVVSQICVVPLIEGTSQANPGLDVTVPDQESLSWDLIQIPRDGNHRIEAA